MTSSTGKERARDVTSSRCVSAMPYAGPSPRPAPRALRRSSAHRSTRERPLRSDASTLGRSRSGDTAA
ncbi:hypothetical protein [Streptomyces sp. RPA4-5]|uniref:hypothetical protein n=1 Tax=Streptomyces sp. RPA4-5 TaxID=2721245 RepID=UPI002001DE37|nr:hypothetical protein [Streptomyces sp. RPA4-5]